MILAAAVLLALVPLIARPFFDLSVDALDEIEAGAFIGSLAAVLLLVAVPVVLLGTAAPWALRLAVGDLDHAGRVAGRLYALSTVGSLTGTMLAALVLIPFVGTQRTFLVFALALAPVAAAGLGWRFAAVPVALAAAIALPVGTLKAADDGRILFEDESEHQYIRVTEEPDGDRVLELNEGQAIHSLLPARGYLTADYWDSFLVLPFAARAEPPRRIAILGNAAGTIARSYGHFWPETEVDGVEIDPELSEVGYRYFDMGSNPNLTVYDEDARPWLRRSGGGYDLIVVDAYRQPYIPFYMVTRGVLRARPRPARARRGGDRQRRPSGGLRRVRAGARRDDGGGLPDRAPRPGRADEHADARHRGARLGRRSWRRPPARGCAATCAISP